MGEVTEKIYCCDRGDNDKLTWVRWYFGVCEKA